MGLNAQYKRVPTLGRRCTNKQLKVRVSWAASRAASRAKCLRVLAANHAAVVAKLATSSTTSGVKQLPLLLLLAPGSAAEASSARQAWSFSNSARFA